MKKHNVIAYVGAVVIFLIGFFLTFTIASGHRNYVSSVYSKYCYNYDDVNGNIDKPVYYATLPDCNKPLKK